ncbi:hypothetical protein PG984_011865 [Apiospora sp. TS-2023a]
MASLSPPQKAKVAPSKPNEATEHSPDHLTDFWGTVMTDNGERDVRMKDDTGTPVNWIHPDLAKRLKLEVESLSSSDTRGFLDFSGKTFTAKQAVHFSWSGRKPTTYFEQFYIAPAKSDIQVVLGKAFVDTHGRDREKKEKQEIVANELKNERDAKEAKDNDAVRKPRKGDREPAARRHESRAQKKHRNQ